MKNILVVDDSALMRKEIRRFLDNAGYDVDVARHGKECLDKLKLKQFDAVTLDINMPVMDGLTCLSHIMTEMPVPVVMVSSLTEKGALATFEALEMGASDYVAKPDGTVSLSIDEIEKELILKVKAALRSRMSKARNLRQRLKSQHLNIVKKPSQRSSVRSANNVKISKGIVIIGVSTGGPATLEEVLSGLPSDFPLPILVAQHMPAKFTSVFAQRLNKSCALNVAELNKATELKAGTVLIARGGTDVKLIERLGKTMAINIPVRSEFLWHPSVELMAKSVGDFYDEKSIVCVQLTGMGNDGARAMTDLHAKGARTIAESEESAVVFGMPQKLIEYGGAEVVLESKNIAKKLMDWVC